MTKRFYKHKILLDENVHYRIYFPLLNNLFDVKHITEDYNQIGLPDPEVYKLAIKLERIIITFNAKDFRELAKTNDKIGVVGISSNLPVTIIDEQSSCFAVKN